jgi:predicted Rossmann fold flavoprotein
MGRPESTPLPMTDPLSFDTIIIGGGAAGLMCALTAGQRGRRVLVVEHANRVGKKILMSGGGRCNFTNTGTSPANFLSANPHFCKSALARYTPGQFIALVESHGIAYHEKELGQLFCDDSSKQIVRMLLDECAKAETRIETGCSVTTIERDGAGFSIGCSLGTLHAPSLVVATGGLSIPAMGATGFGYDIARQFGHRLLPTRAGLVPLTLTGSYLEHYGQLSGVSLPIIARLGRTSFSNAMLITHRGLSGPAILQISSYWKPGDPLQIDLLPHADALELLLAGQRERPAAELRTWLTERLPKRFAQRFCEIHADERPLRQYSKPEMVAIAAKLKEWPVVPSGTEGYRTAEVTLGGVDTLEVSSTSMESRLVPGLYFIGEVLDVTGHLGGYNFQWAWASGRAAGLAV